MTLSERLTEALDAKGATKAELARACRVKPPSVSDWFSGKTKVLKADTLLAAASFLNVSPCWLSTGHGPRHRQLATDTPVTEVQEPLPSYSANWPFKRIPLSSTKCLSSDDLAYVEGRLKAVLDEISSG